MNRRNFIESILVAGAAFSILPGAGRIWRVTRTLPDAISYIDASGCSHFIAREWIETPILGLFPGTSLRTLPNAWAEFVRRKREDLSIREYQQFDTSPMASLGFDHILYRIREPGLGNHLAITRTTYRIASP